jgi:hypothetical protein
LITDPLVVPNTDLGGICSMVMVCEGAVVLCVVYTALKVACWPACTDDDRDWILEASEDPAPEPPPDDELEVDAVVAEPLDEVVAEAPDEVVAEELGELLQAARTTPVNRRPMSVATPSVPCRAREAEVGTALCTVGLLFSERSSTVLRPFFDGP